MPWNEANIDHFGGHTIDEMCSLQKAAYLGFKSRDPGVRSLPRSLHCFIAICMRFGMTLG